MPWFERAVDLDPTWEPALANLIETLAALDRAADATRRTAQWTELLPGGESYRALASARLLSGQFPQAVEAGRRALELDPGIVSRRSLAEALVYDGQPEEAEALLRSFFTSTARIEDRRSASEMMIHALELQGRRRDALGWPSSLSMRVAEGIAAVEEFERGPGNIWRGWRLAELLLGKARAHERLGEPEKAIATVDRLLAGWKHADPDLPRLAEAKALRAHLAASVSSRGRVSKSAFDARRP